MKAYRNGRDVIIEGATNENILGGSFRNFKGEKRQFNAPGKRNFNLRIDGALVPFFTEELNCNVKQFGGDQESGEPPIYFVKVNVNDQTSNRPPKIQMLGGNKKLTELTPDQYGMLDGAYFENVDMVISLYEKYEHASLYMNLGVFTLKSDPITEKYARYFDDNNIDPNATDELSDMAEEVPFN